MTHIPTLDFRKMERVLIHLGFTPVRQKGSHILYSHPDGRTTTLFISFNTVL